IAALECIAFRYDATETISMDQIEAWRAQGLRILAFRRQSGAAQPPSELSEAIRAGDTAIIAGPEEAIRSLLFGTRAVLSETRLVGEVSEVTSERALAGE